MRAIIDSDGITFFREEGDKKYYGMKFAKGEHALFRAIAKWLNARGFDVIKKRAQNDGHMIGDIYQPYIRTRKRVRGIPHIMIYSGFYALRGANEDWNKKGKVTLIIVGDCFEQDQDTRAIIVNLASRYPGLEVK